MNIAALLSPERVRYGAHATSKKRSLELLSELLNEDATGPDTRSIFESLIGRERLGSTGLGRGVALPHARLPGLDAPVAAVLNLDTGVDFDAVDRQPVDLLFALLVPEESTDEHLRILATLAEMFSDTAFCEHLRASGTDRSLYEQVSQRLVDGAPA
ncbi:Nitrogen regulatory protein [wastewater metagenome]|uniref:Nitrogen regulatory protein n=2 Tax=unclassified sequences TaxID=12908 RepID=A0A5B8R8T7_9ZZZZ|nr:MULTISPECIES: PTS sugar transporter subunit IIA [Arhodomonas]MCS4504742.1 PTS sugar transporter subunit IIA [Arhodomonas aquaeolei]QEA04941.1 nitrogen regulatory protein [uncultured organism]